MLMVSGAGDDYANKNLKKFYRGVFYRSLICQFCIFNFSCMCRLFYKSGVFLIKKVTVILS